MPSYLNNARVKKPDHINNTRRNSSSPFSAAPRIKSTQRTKSLTNGLENEPDDDELRLDATGKILTVVNVDSATDVLSAIHYSHENMFDPIPERAGMNSVRIAEVLNFRKNLPPVVSLAHVHALISASSKTERQISTLLDTDALRKIQVVGRGNDISGTSDFLIPTPLLESSLRSTNSLAAEVVDSFLAVLKHNPRVSSLPSNLLPPTHITALSHAGFLVFLPSSARDLSFTGSALIAPRTISRAHSGSAAAVGGSAAFEELGGTGGARRHFSPRGSSTQSQASGPANGHGHGRGELSLSLPNLGPYIRLLTAARTHLLDLLSKSSPHRELPLSLLRERWDGAIDNPGSVSVAKRARGEFAAVMPGNTKKWRVLRGVRFEWVIEEALGAGEVELFETGSVGVGVRGVR